ncbi:DUF1003 domain-containing protein [Microvirga puerhi]|uniref:DUF1003 domain-containing protein n=1 Tax=Microvirga puerhi TaxID=2876078 RepID=A0ABS7VMB2_9HYPH|nr:DUF1003 domain-containing protein [Microvirga puerhi]MBZ6076634.1 DUF1003 domain-containing protein [Microvirga puerhi]
MNTEVRFLAQHLLHAGLTPLDARDRRVIARVARRVHTARNLNREFDDRLTMGQRLADRVAAVGGSWGFIVGFGVFLGIWALLNVVLLSEKAFDPYPFVFLNLLLSMLAALQAPVIMMSQNRQAAKDRLAAALDYEVNLKSEVQIANLGDKMDALQAQMERLMAIQAANSNAKPASTIMKII